MTKKRARRRPKPGVAPPAADRPLTPHGNTPINPSFTAASADTALRLLQDLKAKRIDPQKITANQRRGCLMLLANGTQTSAELAVLFQVASSTIRKDFLKIRDEVGREVREWTTSEVVGQLAMVAEKTTAAAMKQDDPGLAWNIQRDFAKLLKELGVIQPQHDPSGFQLTLQGIGEGYDRAKESLILALNPILTGTHEPMKSITPRLEPPKEKEAQDLAVPQDSNPAPKETQGIDPRLLGY